MPIQKSGPAVYALLASGEGRLKKKEKEGRMLLCRRWNDAYGHILLVILTPNNKVNNNLADPRMRTPKHLLTFLCR